MLVRHIAAVRNDDFDGEMTIQDDSHGGNSDDVGDGRGALRDDDVEEEESFVLGLWLFKAPAC